MGDLWLDRDGLQVLTIKAGKRNGSPPHLFYSPSFFAKATGKPSHQAREICSPAPTLTVGR